MIARASGWGVVFLFFVLFLILLGCQTAAPTQGHNIRFHLEATDDEARHAGAIPLRLPFSGVVLQVAPSSVLTESEIVDVQWVRAGSGFRSHFEIQPRFLMRFRFNADGSDILERLSHEHPGAHLVLLVDGDPWGAFLLEDPVYDGELQIAPEIRAREVPGQVDSLRRALHRLKQVQPVD